MDIVRDLAIVLTGTIVPNSNLVAHTDSVIRRLEYLRAIKFYKNFAHVYFLENSIYPLLSDSEFLEIENVSLKKFSPSKHYSRGKGYQEFEMINSWLVTEENLPSRFIKVTGRYLIKNFKEIFDECVVQPVNFILIDQFFHNSWANTCLFYIGTDYYKKEIINIYLDCDDEKWQWIELILYQKLCSAKLNFHFFNHEPYLVAISGSTKRDLQDGKIKHFLKLITRRVNSAFNKKYIYFRGIKLNKVKKSFNLSYRSKNIY